MSNEKLQVCLCEGCGEKFTAEWVDIEETLREDGALLCPKCYRRLSKAIGG
jgi:hypothetical protein